MSVSDPIEVPSTSNSDIQKPIKLQDIPPYNNTELPVITENLVPKGCSFKKHAANEYTLEEKTSVEAIYIDNKHNAWFHDGLTLEHNAKYEGNIHEIDLADGPNDQIPELYIYTIQI
ncbi:hypothetical protein IW261DRAFT_1424634 [Armillaria novae-zelandiae]|uniref:Uncharacterized protein n=1 Tax=Armillaria novae-zelandiae TaxID=153914 RepID=A0AA39NUJ6_9AGAR|nr:hypothetical protein IW261DRAFT_1424634 [Armillaria novae-zelandiae]